MGNKTVGPTPQNVGKRNPKQNPRQANPIFQYRNHNKNQFRTPFNPQLLRRNEEPPLPPPMRNNFVEYQVNIKYLKLDLLEEQVPTGDLNWLKMKESLLI